MLGVFWGQRIFCGFLKWDFRCTMYPKQDHGSPKMNQRYEGLEDGFSLFDGVIFRFHLRFFGAVQQSVTLSKKVKLPAGT